MGPKARYYIFPPCTLAVIVGFYKMPLIALLGVTIIAVWWLYLLQRRRYIVAFFCTALGGFLAEAASVAAGAWTYTFPDVIGLPLWLFVVWGISALFIIDTWEQRISSN